MTAASSKDASGRNSPDGALNGNNTRPGAKGSGRSSAAASSVAAAPQKPHHRTAMLRAAEKKRTSDAQFLGRETQKQAGDLPPFWSTSKHGVPFNAGDPLDNAIRSSANVRGAHLPSSPPGINPTKIAPNPDPRLADHPAPRPIPSLRHQVHDEQVHDW